jgi:hypothetical protein
MPCMTSTIALLPRRLHRPGRLVGAMLATLAALAVTAAQAADTTPAQQLERFAAQAGGTRSAERGRTFFTTPHGGEWSCASCHGAHPVAPGKHASTGKTIDALAPAANPQAFTDSARVDKWFRRNCRDVLQRECSAAEKADVIAWLLTLQR